MLALETSEFLVRIENAKARVVGGASQWRK